MDARRPGKRRLEALIRAGALDSLAPQTEAVLPIEAHSLAAGMRAPSRGASAPQRCRGHGGTLAGLEAPAALRGLRQASAPLSEQERLRGEKETLGLYLTGHPIDSYEDELRSYGAHAPG